MEKLTFENLPEAVGRLLEKMENLERMLQGKEGCEEQKGKLMNVKQAAEFMELSVQTIYTKVCRGQLTAYKPGHRLYFDQTILEEYIRSAKKHSNKDLGEIVEANFISLQSSRKRRAFRK